MSKINRKNKFTNICILGTRLHPKSIFSLLPIQVLKENSYSVYFADISNFNSLIKSKFELRRINEDIVSYQIIDNLNNFKDYITKFNSLNTIILFGGWQVNLDSTLAVLKELKFKTISLNLLPIGRFKYLPLIFLYIKKKIKKTITPDVCIVEGYLKSLICKSFGIKKIWNFHSPNYEHYLREKEEMISLFPDKEYISYIDQNFISHPDFEWFGISKNNFEIYYKDLNNFFLEIEKQYNLPIVFALHPTANIEEYKQFFPNFMFVKHKTYELIHHSKYIIAHFSTAIEYAILEGKPMMFIDIPQKYSEKIHDNMIIFSKRIKIKPISIYEKVKLKFSFSRKVYNKYTHRYIKSKYSENLLFVSLFLKKLEENE